MTESLKKGVYQHYLRILHNYNYEDLCEEEKEVIRSIAYEQLSDLTGLNEWTIVSIIQTEEFKE